MYNLGAEKLIPMEMPKYCMLNLMKFLESVYENQYFRK